MLPRALLWPFSDHVTKHRPGVLGSKGTARSSCCSPIQTMLKAPGAPELPVLMATLTPKVSMGLFSPARASHATQDFPRPEGGWLLGDSARACSGGCLCPCIDLAEDGVLGQGSGESSKESQFDPGLPNCYEDMFVRVGGDTYFI